MAEGKRRKGKAEFAPRTCRLCLQLRPLCHSHVFPDFFWTATEEDRVAGDDPNPKPWINVVSSKGGGTRSTVRKEQAWRMASAWEWLLCLACEGKLSAWEAKARQELYLVQEGPIHKAPLFLVSPPGEDVLGFDPFHVGDPAAFRLFLLSLLWRSSIAAGDFYRKVKLGPDHEEALRRMLHDGDPGDFQSYTFSVSDVRHFVPGSSRLMGVEDWIEQPDSYQHNGVTEVRLGMGGYLILFSISPTPLPAWDRFGTLRKDGLLRLVILNFRAALAGWLVPMPQKRR